MIYSTNYTAPIGSIKLASDGEFLIGLWIEGQKYFGNTGSEVIIEKNAIPCELNKCNIPIFNHTKDWLDRYFTGKKPAISELPLAPMGSEFRRGVWDILCQIPYGKVISYGDIAKKMAMKMNCPTMSAQAVGGAVGHNPISIIIPCHRVVGASGSLTGYAAGIERKVWLLTREGVDIEQLTMPKKGTAL